MTRACLTVVLALILVAIFTPRVLAQEPTPFPAPAIHIVQQGETIATIAARYSITSDALITANNLSASIDVNVGQRLIIPLREPLSASSTQTVGMSDSLTEIAVQSGVDVTRLAALNRIVNPALIFAGQSLGIPSGGSTGASVAQVDSTSSLWHLSLRYNIPIAELVHRNNLHDPFTVAPGQLISIPITDVTPALLSAPWKSITLHSAPLQVGRSGALVVETTIPGILTASFIDRPLQFSADGTTYTALIGINRWSVSGLYPLTLTFQSEDGTRSDYTRMVRVDSGGYAAEIIRLSADDLATRTDPAVVQEEAAYIAGFMSGFTPDKHWDGLFLLPAPGVLTSAFGTARSFDEGATFNTYHAGADFFGRSGYPIYAPADGVVVATGVLEIRGYFTIIDHGWGVYTGYWHQSGILVELGAPVTAGQNIGTIGSTGTVTAAHLHWEMWVGGVSVDPLQWVRTPFP